MAAPSVNKQIDELYQLRPEEFTAARNELAKRVEADEKSTVRALKKPTAPAWAVNQLYWRSRRTWDALVRAAEHLRDAHRSALKGRAVDLRKADTAHREALSQAVKETMSIVSAAGQPSTAALREAVMQTLQALPADIEPGRLTTPLSPAGFGLLEGITPRAPVQAEKAAAPKSKTATPPRETRIPLTDPEAERRRVLEDKRARAEAVREEKRHRAEAERQRKEEQKRAAETARRVAQLTKMLDRARQEEEELRRRLDRASHERENAEKELAKLRSVT